MIIKATRGDDFAGLVDYVARIGGDARKGAARILALSGLYDLRTAAAQLAYDAALDPSRSRPVVHLIARAEKSLSDDQYLVLAKRMLKVAGLEGHRFLAVLHDDDGHLHVVASEVNEDGAVPPRFLWSRDRKREVSAYEAEGLPRGTVESRAWDSHLAWRLTRLARDVEVEWDLRRLSSSSRDNDQIEPQREQWQKERLAQTGKVPLQDRYWEEVRAALALTTWDDRAEALAKHGLAIRTHEIGGRVRGLQLQNLTSAEDFVKISAFDMGGMPKLDASADQSFVEWASRERSQRINLTKAIASKNPDMIAAQAAFKIHQKEWRRGENARVAAYRQRRRDTNIIDADLANFADQYRPVMTVAGFKRARAEKRRGLKVLADARLAEGLATAGPPTAKPVFVDFIKARAGAGDAVATRVHQDLTDNVSETRRRGIDLISVMARELAEAARSLRVRRQRIEIEVAVATTALRATASQVARRASAQAYDLASTMAISILQTRKRLAQLTARLARQVYDAGYRIRVQSNGVLVDRWRPGLIEQDIMTSVEGRREFASFAHMQDDEVVALRDSIIRNEATRRTGDAVEFDEARSDIGNPAVLRWATEPEIIDTLNEVDRQRRDRRLRSEQAAAERRLREEVAVQQRGEAAELGRRDAERLKEEQAASLAAQLAQTGRIIQGDGPVPHQHEGSDLVPDVSVIGSSSKDRIADAVADLCRTIAEERILLVPDQEGVRVVDDAVRFRFGLTDEVIKRKDVQARLEIIAAEQFDEISPLIDHIRKHPEQVVSDSAGWTLGPSAPPNLVRTAEAWRHEPHVQDHVQRTATAITAASSKKPARPDADGVPTKPLKTSRRQEILLLAAQQRRPLTKAWVHSAQAGLRPSNGTDQAALIVTSPPAFTPSPALPEIRQADDLSR